MSSSTTTRPPTSERRRVLAAPDSFKGTFGAIDVAAAMARGIEAAGLNADICPAADGGEGTMAALLSACGGQTVTERVHDPLGREIEASFALLPGGDTAVIEIAQASGLALVTEAERDPERASTRGTGELILAAARAGARSILVAAGGSATTDGGVGAITAIEEAGGLDGLRLTVLCDVRTPWELAAEVFAPQKGADAAAVRRLAQRLERLAARFPRDPRGVPLSGSAGGLSGGLWAAFNARLELGASFVLDAVGFDQRLRIANAVVSGEGQLDAQSFLGKVIGEIAARTREAGVPLHAIVGRSRMELADARSAGLEGVSEASTLEEIEATAHHVAGEIAGQDR
jgi:glycerate kinase